MTAIRTGDNATVAAKTRVVIKLRKKNGISFEYIGGIADRIEGKAREFLYGVKTFLLEIVIKSGFQIFDYAIAILHDCCSNLQGICAQQQKLQPILPGFNAAHTADM